MITHLLNDEALAPEPLASSGSMVEIVGDSYHHLFRSRRLAVGAELRLVDGHGLARSGLVSRIERQRALVEVGEVVASREPRTKLHLLVGALRPERAAWLVEKATELGVCSCHFLATARTPRKYGSGRLDRLRRVAAAAVEQCHRSRLPHIDGVHPWSEAAGLLSSLVAAKSDAANSDPASGAWRFVLDSSGTPWSTEAAEGLAASEAEPEVVVFIGPEGGWSASELEQLGSWQVEAINFGSRVLRVETAALAAAAWMIRD